MKGLHHADPFLTFVVDDVRGPLVPRRANGGLWAHPRVMGKVGHSADKKPLAMKRQVPMVATLP